MCHFDINATNNDGNSIKQILADCLPRDLNKAIKDNNLVHAEEILSVVQKSGIISADVIMNYPELKTTIVHHVAKTGTIEMTKLFLDNMAKMYSKEELLKIKKEKDLLMGCTLLLYVYKECSFEAIMQVSAFCEGVGIKNQAKNKDTCLHLLVMNRKLTLDQKVGLAKKLINDCPELCNMKNKQGHKPLTLWMLALSKQKDEGLVNEIIELLASKTDLKDWKDIEKIQNTNLAKLKDAFEFREILTRNKMKLQLEFERVAPIPGKKFYRYVTKRKGKRKKITFYRKYPAWIKKEVKKRKPNYEISPLEAAVIANRGDWVEKFIQSWGLKASLIMNEGRHILGFALENCDPSISRLLIEKGDLQRYITDPQNATFSYDLDAVVMKAFLNIRRNYYRIKNEGAVRKEDASFYLRFREYIGNNTLKNCMCYINDNEDVMERIKDTTGMPEEQSKRMANIKELLGIYISSIVANKPTSIRGQHDTEMYKYLVTSPLIYTEDLLKYALEIPEFAPHALNILKAKIERTDNMDDKNSIIKNAIDKALSMGNKSLFQKLIQLYPEAYKDYLAEWDRTDSAANYAILYSENPQEALKLLLENIDPEKFSLDSLLRWKLYFSSLRDGPCIIRNDKLHILCAKFQCIEVAAKHFFLSGKIYKNISNGPVFLWMLINEKIPEMTTEFLENGENFINRLIDGFKSMIRERQHNIAYDLISYIWKISLLYVKTKIKSLGSDFDVESEDFKFYYLIFRRHTKGNFFTESKPSLLKVLSEGDIQAIQFYAHFFNKFLPQFTKLPKYKTTCTFKICQLLRNMFGISLRDKETKNLSSLNEILANYSHKDEIDPFMESKPKALHPYIVYNLFSQKKRKYKLSKSNPMDNCEIRNYTKILKYIPFVGPTNICKMIGRMQDLFDEVKTNIRMNIEKLANIVEDPKKAKALQVLYELQYKDTLAIESYIDHENPKSKMIYALISRQYGYVFTHVCRDLNQEFNNELATKYGLPLNMSVPELRPNKCHKQLWHEKEWRSKIKYKLKIENEEAKKQIEKIRKTKSEEAKKKIEQRRKNRRSKKPATQLQTKRRKKIPIKKEIRQPLYVEERKDDTLECPIVELYKKYGDKIDNSMMDVEGKILAINATDKKKILYYVAHYLCFLKKMTPKLFQDLWQYREETNFLRRHRFTDDLPIYEFIATMDSDFLYEVLLYITEQDKARVHKVMNVWLNVALQNYDVKLLMTLYALKTLFILDNAVVPTYGAKTNLESALLQELYNMKLASFCKMLFKTEELALMWNKFFSFDRKLLFKKFAEKNISGIRLYHRDIIPVLAALDMGILRKYMEYINNLPENWYSGTDKLSCAKDIINMLCKVVTSKGLDAVSSSLNNPYPELMMRCRNKPSDAKALDVIKFEKHERYNINCYESNLATTRSWVHKEPKDMVSSELKEYIKTHNLSAEDSAKYRKMKNESHPHWSCPLVCTMLYFPAKEISFDLISKVKEIAQITEEIINSGANDTEAKQRNTFTLLEILELLVCMNLPELSSLASLCLNSLDPTTQLNFKILGSYKNIKGEIYTKEILQKFVMMESAQNIIYNKKSRRFLKIIPKNVLNIMLHMFAEKAVSENNVDDSRNILVLAALNGFKDVVGILMDTYISSIDTPIDAYIPKLKAFVKYPFMAAISKSTQDLSVVMQFISRLPKPYVFNAEKIAEMPRRLVKYKKITPMEVAIAFGKMPVIEELMKISQYKQYIQSKGEEFVEIALEKGNVELFRQLLKIVTVPLNMKHLLKIIGTCSIQHIAEIVKELTGNFTAEEILGYKDERGNNILHHLAMQGRSQLLFVLINNKIFDFRDKARYKEHLIQKNNDKCCPYVVALMSGHLNIANAFYVEQADIKEYSEEELMIITKPQAPFKALSTFLNNEKYNHESALWDALYPRRSEIIKLFNKLAPLSSIAINKKRPKVRVSMNGISYLTLLFQEGLVGMALAFFLFRRDLFSVARLLPNVFKTKEDIFNVIIENKNLTPLAQLFIKVNFAPSSKEEMMSIFCKHSNNHYLKKEDSQILQLMQMFSLLKMNTKESYGHLSNAEKDSLFLTPYQFFTGKKTFTLGENCEFAIEEFDCLLPEKTTEEKPAFYELNLSTLAVCYGKILDFRSFTTILAYAYKYDHDLMNRITSDLDANAIFSLLSMKYYQESLWLLQVAPAKIKLLCNTDDKLILTEAKTEMAVNLNKNAMSVLIHFALYNVGKYVICTNNNNVIEDKPKSAMKLIIEKAVYKMAKIYEGSVVASDKPGKMKSVSFHLTKINLNILMDCFSQALDITRKNESKILNIVGAEKQSMVLPESNVAEMLAESLNPKGILFYNENGLMDIEVDNVDAMRIANAVSKSSNVTLIEGMCKTFTDNYVFGIDHFRETEAPFIFHVKIGVIDDSSKDTVTYEITSFNEQEIPKEYVASVNKICRRKNLAKLKPLTVSINYTINISSLKSNMQELLEALNFNLAMEIEEKLIAKISPIQLGNVPIQKPVVKIQAPVVKIQEEVKKELERPFKKKGKKKGRPVKRPVNRKKKKKEKPKLSKGLPEVPEIEFSIDEFILPSEEGSETYTLNTESAIKQMKTLEKYFYSDIALKVERLCKYEANRLFNSIKNMREEASIAPIQIDQSFPEEIKKALDVKLGNESGKLYELKMYSQSSLEMLKKKIPQLVKSSMNFCASKGLKQEDNQIAVVLSEDPISKKTYEWVIPETHVLYPCARILAAEAAFIKKTLTFTRFNCPRFRINMKNFVERIAVPIAEKALQENTKEQTLEYSNPLLVVDDLFGSSIMFTKIVHCLFTKLVNIEARFGVKPKVVLIDFKEETEKVAPYLTGFPAIDQLVQFTDVEIEGNQEAFTATLKYLNVWKQGIQTVLNKKVESIANITKNGIDYTEKMLNEVKILESVLSETEIFDILLEKNVKGKDTERNKRVSCVFAKDLKVTVDWESLYEHLIAAAPKKESDSKDYYKEKDNFYVQVSRIGMILAGNALALKINKIAKRQVEDIFCAFINTNAHNSLLGDKEKENIGSFPLVPLKKFKDQITVEAKNAKTEFHDFFLEGSVLTNKAMNFGLYRRISKATIMTHPDKFKKSMFLIRDWVQHYNGKSTLIPMRIHETGEKMIIQRGSKLRRCRFDNASDKIYIKLTPEMIKTVKHNAVIYITDSENCLRRIKFGKLSHIYFIDNFLELSKLYESGKYLTDILPNEICIKFSKEITDKKPNVIVDKKLTVDFIVDVNKEVLNPMRVQLKDSLPMKMIYYGGSTLRASVLDIQQSMTSLISKVLTKTKYEYHDIKLKMEQNFERFIQRINTKKPLPSLFFDFSGLKGVSYNCLHNMNTYIEGALHSIYDAVIGIVTMKGEKLAYSLTGNLNKQRDKVAQIHIVRRFFEFLSKRPIKISFAQTEEYNVTPASHAFCDAKNFNVVVQYINYVEEEYVQGNMHHDMRGVVCNAMINEFYKFELKKMLEGMKSVKEGNAPELSAGIMWNIRKPFKMSYMESIQILNEVCHELYPETKSKINVLSLVVDEEQATANQLQILIGMPVLLQHITNALRLAKSLEVNLNIRGISIAIKESTMETLDFWKLFITSDTRELTFEIFNHSSHGRMLPLEIEILERIMLLSCKTEDVTSEKLLKKLNCATIKENGQFKVLHPLIQQAGTYKETFKFFTKSLKKTIDISKTNLRNEISVCLISLTSPLTSEIPVKHTFSDDKMVISFIIPEMKKVYRLVIRMANRVIFSKVLLCFSKKYITYSLPNQFKEKGVSEDKPRAYDMFFASREPGLMAAKDMNLLAYRSNFCLIDNPLVSVFTIIPLTMPSTRYRCTSHIVQQITDDTILCRFDIKKNEMPAVLVDKITSLIMPVTYSLDKEEDEKERMTVEKLKTIVDEDENLLQLYSLYC